MSGVELERLADPRSPFVFGEEVEHDLVPLTAIGEHLRIGGPGMFAHSSARAALEGAAAELSERGLGLLVLGGYRPLTVQIGLWLAQGVVRTPHLGRHTRGAVVDVEPFWLADGSPAAMTGPGDGLLTEADRSPGWDKRALAAMSLVESVLARCGLASSEVEWWHRCEPVWRELPVFDIGIEALAAGSSTARPVLGLEKGRA